MQYSNIKDIWKNKNIYINLSNPEYDDTQPPIASTSMLSSMLSPPISAMLSPITSPITSPPTPTQQYNSAIVNPASLPVSGSIPSSTLSSTNINDQILKDELLELQIEEEIYFLKNRLSYLKTLSKKNKYIDNKKILKIIFYTLIAIIIILIISLFIPSSIPSIPMQLAYPPLYNSAIVNPASLYNMKYMYLAP